MDAYMRTLTSADTEKTALTSAQISSLLDTLLCNIRQTRQELIDLGVIRDKHTCLAEAA
ncbi:hypothetical protein [Chromobacterium subtsugae]|uniref:hypothetical protein n=1 Tax=Chromobacterium subtsugae TaxID=251747 RepID=UPI000ACC7DA3|nr:hypothetical protein [Chromobacterium subtsugae]